MTTLYLRLGGRENIERFTYVIFDLMRHDDILAEELDRIDHPWVIDRLNSLLVFIFGGSPFYEGASIRSDFRALLASDHHYNRFACHFQTALQANAIDATLRREAQAVIELVRDYVLERQLA
ncbi:truncated hemoglobin YjbI [Breoghania corrubedonensis]|uniref:Truncated hemoglobin YjbI n=1 Tax=Breoghania corrubedonensis TaxID=665038 RepID=A0A2T5VCN9_9HYPH|nr:hypothetical protein [Breoghania corrubedonensis]PTW61504.1 truncated hemoglobin YjbI [Breoghania corrubedonensis]